MSAYPYPVLGHADDVKTEFSVFNVVTDATSLDVAVRFRVRIGSRQVVQLVELGDLAVVCPWSCGATVSTGYLNPIVVGEFADGWEFEGYIDHSAVRDRISMRVLLIANRPLLGFRFDHQHDDYGSAAFDVQRGDVVGLAGSFDVPVHKLYDPMQPPVSALFRFESAPDMPRGMHVHAEPGDQVVVRVSDSLFDAVRLAKLRPNVQIAMVVLPALMELLHIVRSNIVAPTDDDFSEYGWHVALMSILEKRRLLADLDDGIFTVAQKLLGFPVDAGLHEINQVSEADDD